jgi:hypothetical protein
VFLHVRDCPIVGTTARRHELIVEDGLDGTPAAQAVFIEALDQKKLESLRCRKSVLAWTSKTLSGVQYAHIVTISRPAELT